MVSDRRPILLAGRIAATAILALGVFWAYSRGADDFRVFFAAWKHAVAGEGMRIYTNSPDRFLYAPGFAWLFSPLAFLPFQIALALWCLLKIFGAYWLTKAKPLAPWALVLLARPVLIDLQYGQVNFLILLACAWALSRHWSEEESWSDFASWFFAGVAAIAKIFPLPLLFVPFLVRAPKRRIAEQLGAISGVILVLALPFLMVGFDDALSLMAQWKAALLERGLPLESHNQSFAAFLHHVASGEPTEIIAQHRKLIYLGWKIFTDNQIEAIALAWGALWMALTLYWIAWVPRKMRMEDAPLWSAVLCGILILPSHLVWKPYFVMGVPLALIAFEKRSWLALSIVALSGTLMNLTGFDIVGQSAGAMFEAACVMLWAYLLLLSAALMRA